MTVAGLLASFSSGAAGPSLLFGAQYANWTGTRIVFSTTSNGSGATSFNGLDGSFDSNTNRLYDAYAGAGTPRFRTGGYFGWATVNSFPSVASADGRSSTIGYFGGVAYLYVGNVDRTIDIYTLSTLAFVATWTVSNFVNQVGGLAYDGAGGLYAIDIGAATTLFRINTLQPINQTVTAATVCTLGRAVQFGLLFFNGTTVISRSTPGTTVTEFNISNGAIVNTYLATAAGYGISIDYGNKLLYTGGLSDTTMRRFPGT